MKKILHIALPDFGPLDMKESTRRLQAYRRWAWDQKLAGRPVTCWCLYKWIAGNNAAESRKKIIPRGEKKRLRPLDSTSNEWQAWRNHQKRGGTLSFLAFQAKTKERQNRGQGFRSDLVCAPLNEGASRTLKRSPAEILARVQCSSDNAAEVRRLLLTLPLPPGCELFVSWMGRV